MKMLLAMIATVITVERAIAGCATPDAPPPPRPLRFLSFNVLHGGMTSELWGDGEQLEDRLDATKGALRALDADVIGLQEASRGWWRGDVSDQLAEALGFQEVDTGATSRLFGGGPLGFLSAAFLELDEGPAVLSRYPITNSHSWLLAQCHTFYRRMLLCADVCTPWGPIRACSTHLNGSACQAANVAAQLNTIADGVPLVLMGDLNETEATGGLEILRDRAHLVDTFRVANPAVPGFTGDQELDVEQATVAEREDYVLIAGAPSGRRAIVASRIVLDHPFHSADGDLLWSSDHYGVLSDVALFGAPSATEAAEPAPAATAARHASACAPTSTSCGHRDDSSHARRRPPA